jgi:hypothetical protein
MDDLLDKMSRHSFKCHQALSHTVFFSTTICDRYSIAFLLMMFLTLTQQYKRRSMQTRIHVGKRGALGLVAY